MSSGQSQTCSKLIRCYQGDASFQEIEKVWSCWFQYKHKHLWTMTRLHHKQNWFCSALPKLSGEKFPSIDHRKHWVSETKEHRCFIGTWYRNAHYVYLCTTEMQCRCRFGIREEQLCRNRSSRALSPKPGFSLASKTPLNTACTHQ